MTKIKVTGCKDCPFERCQWLNCCYNPLLEIPKEINSKVYFNGESPSWCPLKKESITIEIEAETSIKRDRS